MAVKTFFKLNDYVNILSLYDLGEYIQAEPIPQGTVQTNYMLQTGRGKYVFRYYENRSEGSVLFESHLLAYLGQRRFPCPTQVKNRQEQSIGFYQGRPYCLFEYIDGQPVEKPSPHQRHQLIQIVAELQNITADFQSPYVKDRWHYEPALCRNLAQAEAARAGTDSAFAKLAWLTDELKSLELPPSLPRGICHGDLHFSNVLYQGEQLVALLDFDDANLTYQQFDLVGLIEHAAWPNTANQLDLAKARDIVVAYTKHRPLALIEKQHLFDVYKLSILFDCVWYFDRGTAGDFREKRKIDFLCGLGRQTFFDELFRG